MKQQEQKVYSYHTFIMPFRWEGSHHTQVSMKDICEQMDLRKCWKKLDYSHITEEELGDINQDYRSLYAEKQYFHLYTQDMEVQTELYPIMYFICRGKKNSFIRFKRMKTYMNFQSKQYG